MRFLLLCLLSLGLLQPLGCDRDAAAPEDGPSAAEASPVSLERERQAPAEPPPGGETGRRPQPGPAAGEPAPRREGPPRKLSDHRLAYLEESARQMQRLERAIGEIGSTRLGSGALAAAALAANGREAWREPAATWTRRAIESCAGNWHDLDCELVMMNLQRIVLQFPEALPLQLRQRARRAAAQPAPPPEPGLIRDPWSFQRTENQQIGFTARALGAHAVVGDADSPAGLTWSRFAEAFLVAHDRDGWYEADSPGYMATSITALLHLADHAPQVRVRDLAARQLQLLFVRWAENQVGGTPAGPRSRTYVHWAQGTRNTPWKAWAWYAAGLGDGADLPLGDWPEIATAGYEFPQPVVELLRSARSGAPYEVQGRRSIRMDRRRNLDAATYSWVTPGYVLSSAPAVDGLSLAVSGGQEIQVTLFAEGPEFAPLYLWSRVQASRSERWRSRADQEKGLSRRNLAVAWMGTPREPGHAWLAAPWSRPLAVSDEVLVTRYGETFVALVAAGGWEVAAAGERFPGFYSGKAFSGSWVAVPKRQPAALGLEVARASELSGDTEPWEAWRKWARRLELTVVGAGGGEGDGRLRRAAGQGAEAAATGSGGPAVPREPQLTLRSTGGQRLVFRPGVFASVDGEALRPRDWSLHESPHLDHRANGSWSFQGAGVSYLFPPLEEVPGSSEEGRPRGTERPDEGVRPSAAKEGSGS